MLEDMKENNVNTRVAFIYSSSPEPFQTSTLLSCRIIKSCIRQQLINIGNDSELLLNTNAKMNKEKNDGQVGGKSCKASQFFN